MAVEVPIAGNQRGISGRGSVPIARWMCGAVGSDAGLKPCPGGILRGGHLRQFHRLGQKPGFSALQIMQRLLAVFTTKDMLLKRRQQGWFGSRVERQGQLSSRLAVRQRALRAGLLANPFRERPLWPIAGFPRARLRLAQPALPCQ